jgi:(E)-4-hydroxy-3-methylbut-2-enyl-diphosphate synthase
MESYCNSLTEYSRFRSREVIIGDVALGGANPIRIQSMTTTDTMDTRATVEQSIRMIEAGSELVRITAPSLREAKNLGHIKKELRDRGYNTPLIADIHFTPNAAEVAARIVEKVRVNPGNYADKKKFEHIEYDDISYNAELERIRDRFIPLVRICKEHGTAMRIGTNHGSLSDRIMSRYGDTPLGMVESAFEFLRICRDENYHDIVLSMKASNTQVMVQAYRLLVSRMISEQMNYPLHLGVTEAGEAEDGRIKSAVGIGTLLEDGLGDTVRVSLTEEPENELPVARTIVERYSDRKAAPEIKPLNSASELTYSPFQYERRRSLKRSNIGADQVPVVITDISHMNSVSATDLAGIGYYYSAELDKWGINDQACDYIYTAQKPIEFEIPGTLGVIMDASAWKGSAGKERHYPLFCGFEYLKTEHRSDTLNFVVIDPSVIFHEEPERVGEFFSVLKSDPTIVLIADSFNTHAMADIRRQFIELNLNGIECPVIIKRNFSDLPDEKLLLHAATDTGALLVDGFGDGLWIKGSSLNTPRFINETTFGILQAARVRISKTEYISCPSCGRTLFDLQETTAKIRSRTNHLKGVKIGIMGCIVNGPGEMADADYGYVGSGPGKITLYKGREVVKKGVASADAVEALIELIKSHGDWVEMPN